jgi:hypothetical protein
MTERALAMAAVLVACGGTQPAAPARSTYEILRSTAARERFCHPLRAE